ncbi:MAG: prolyl oligopeptidase family serine peptidase [Clostridia bacterium]|nr:prolyl oligopeptidase family serine peptidase [Clostridia bacterium]
MTEEKIFDGLKYLVSYPDGFTPDNNYPLVVFLHGAGTRSNDIEVLKRNACFLNLQKRQSRQFVLLAPLCNAHNWNELMQPVIKLVDEVRNSEFIDKSRVYATGNSMGGYGSFELAAIRPEWFAAIMPICGGGIGGFAARLKDIPVRTFHGLCDNVVDPIESIQMAKAINQAGGYAELILFPKHDHNCWDTVYTTEENYDWLFSFLKNGDVSMKTDTLTGEYYG